MIVNLKITWNTPDRYVPLARDIVNRIRDMKCMSNWYDTSITVEPVDTRIYVYGTMELAVLDAFYASMLSFGSIKVLQSEMTSVINIMVNIRYEITPFAETSRPPASSAISSTVSSSVSPSPQKREEPVRAHDIDVEMRLKENQIIMEIKSLCDIFQEPVPVRGFDYSSPEREASFKAWLAEAVSYRDRLNNKLESVKRAISGEAQQRPPTKQTMDIGRCLDALGMPRSIQLRDVNKGEIKRRFIVYSRTASSRDIMDMKRTLILFGLYPRRTIIARRRIPTSKPAEEDKKETENEEKGDKKVSFF